MSITEDELRKFVEEEKWQQASQGIRQFVNERMTPQVAILGAEIFFHYEQYETAKDFIQWGLTIEPTNYELYYMLGNYYSHLNHDQAYLCYENAWNLGKDSEDEDFLKETAISYIKEYEVKVNRVAIAIASYNSAEITKNLIGSIRATCLEGSYEICVADNASEDGIAEWLEQQPDVKLVRNSSNEGFAKASNQAVLLAEKDSDIFFLNNDTILLPNSLFWLRMGLYENETVGATGSVTNNAGNGQKISLQCNSLMEWLQEGTSLNVPIDQPYEKKLMLVGYAMLVRRKVIDEVGMFDTIFGMGNYEDNDLGVRIVQQGYQLILCHNSFVFHYGSMGFRKNTSLNYSELLDMNRKVYKDKWGYDSDYYANARMDIIKNIPDSSESAFRVLEVGCGAGATLIKIQYMWPNSEVKGIELVSEVAKLGANYVDIMEGNCETMNIPYDKGYFDYIIFGDVLEHLLDPDATLRRFRPYLKKMVVC